MQHNKYEADKADNKYEADKAAVNKTEEDLEKLNLLLVAAREANNAAKSQAENSKRQYQSILMDEDQKAKNQCIESNRKAADAHDRLQAFMDEINPGICLSLI
jgi:hypothetical protein